MATLVETKVQLSTFEIIKYQFLHHCFMNKLLLNNTDIICLSLLGEAGMIPLGEFCKLVVDKKVLKNPIGVNNVLKRLIDKKLVVKERREMQMVFLNPELKIQIDGNIVINIKLFKVEGKKTTGNIQTNRREVELA